MTCRALPYALARPDRDATRRAHLHCLVGQPSAGYDRRKRDAGHARVIFTSPNTPGSRRFHSFDISARRPRGRVIEGDA
ncbi:hypothetical protein J2X11_000491 [Aeromicrobium panaciterrae]|uniref:Uncharacterized protein n=1 Tax=Aeromicrobium panaciterrae TaxID=363861 RepID=A0ABU1UKC4_9ACTN|nr:hypothetical protein [Aeromicrobium panaciterrae]